MGGGRPGRSARREEGKGPRPRMSGKGPSGNRLGEDPSEDLGWRQSSFLKAVRVRCARPFEREGPEIMERNAWRQKPCFPRDAREKPRFIKGKRRLLIKGKKGHFLGKERSLGGKLCKKSFSAKERASEGGVVENCRFKRCF